MELLTGEQMKRIDRRAIERSGISGLDLMEAAGSGIAHALLEEHPEGLGKGVWILCGKGNNGGDGLVIARCLASHGVTVRVVLLAAADALTGDAAHNLAAARAAGLDVVEAADESGWNRSRGALGNAGLVVDAILGTGIRGGARGLAATVIGDLNAGGRPVVSVDLPSGLDADAFTVEGPAVFAERTYTLCRPKLPLALAPAADHSRSFRVIPIGIPPEAIAAEQILLEWTDAAALTGLAVERAADSHKGTFGHLLAVAGSRGKSGAAVLVGRAALRCGVGLVTCAVPASVQDQVAVQQAELMTEALAETPDGTLGADAVDAVRALADGKTALAIGPGLGGGSVTTSATRRILESRTLPAVVDADGLNALATTGGVRGLAVPHRPPLVLTPHPGEAARLLDTTTAAVQADRLAAVRELSERSGAVVVLKGHRTLVATPDGRVAVNSSGNPGMATAGTGDVLTGCIGAFLAAGMGAADAARLAAYLHGAAGDLAASDVGEEGLIASDLIDRLPPALVGLRAAG